MTHGWYPSPDDARYDDAAPGDWVPSRRLPSGDGYNFEQAGGGATFRRRPMNDSGSRGAAERSRPSGKHRHRRHQERGSQTQRSGKWQADREPVYDERGYPPPPTTPPTYRQAGHQPIGQHDLIMYGYRPGDADGAHGHPPFGTSASAGTSLFGGHMADQRTAHQDEFGDPAFVLHGTSASVPQSALAQGVARTGGHRRRWLTIGGLLAVVVTVAVAAAAGITHRLGHAAKHTKAAAPGHTLTTPQRIGTYPRDRQAEQQLGISHGGKYLTQIDPGHVTRIVAAVYNVGGQASAGRRVAVIAGKLRHGPQADVVKSFIQQERADDNSPAVVPAGPLGGRAACAGQGRSGICVWVDSDTVGVLVSATMNATSLAHVMPALRAGVEVPSV